MTGWWRLVWRLQPDTTEDREEARLVLAAPGTECDGVMSYDNVWTLTLVTLWCGQGGVAGCLEPGLVTLVQPGQLQPRQPRLGPGGAGQGHFTGTERGKQDCPCGQVFGWCKIILICQCDVM